MRQAGMDQVRSAASRGIVPVVRKSAPCQIDSIRAQCAVSGQRLQPARTKNAGACADMFVLLCGHLHCVCLTCRAAVYQCFNATDDNPCPQSADCQVQHASARAWKVPQHTRTHVPGGAHAPCVIQPCLCVVQSLHLVHARCACVCTCVCVCTRVCTRQVYDESVCGPTYSTAEQIPFCPVPVPPTWPAILQVCGVRTHTYTHTTHNRAADRLHDSVWPHSYVHVCVCVCVCVCVSDASFACADTSSKVQTSTHNTTPAYCTIIKTSQHYKHKHDGSRQHNCWYSPSKHTAHRRAGTPLGSGSRTCQHTAGTKQC